jgi:hypothetical protein
MMKARQFPAREGFVDGDDDRRLDAAVALGIISADQAQAIRDLAPERNQDSASHVQSAASAATLGYVLGAVTVLIAMGWFLSDRWEWLGAGGVLAVTALYATIFLVVARRMRAEGYPQAAGFAVLLAVAMVPVATVAVNELAGWFPQSSPGVCGYQDFVFWACRGEELVVELVTVVAALVALRQVRFSLLVLPIAGLALRFLFHVGAALTGAGLGAASTGWMWMIGASVLTATAYATERAQRGDEDFALWLHLVAAVSAAITSILLIGSFENFRHLLIPGALVSFAFSLRMRRFAWTLLGMGWFVAYLGWLASEVFKDTPFFPIVLAALGIGVIIATVWVQRNSAQLAVRFGGITSDRRPSFPGGVGLLLLPVIVAGAHLPGSAALDRAVRRESAAHRTVLRAKIERENPRGAIRTDLPRSGADSARPPLAPASGETVGRPQP